MQRRWRTRSGYRCVAFQLCSRVVIRGFGMSQRAVPAYVAKFSIVTVQRPLLLLLRSPTLTRTRIRAFRSFVRRLRSGRPCTRTFTRPCEAVRKRLEHFVAQATPQAEHFRPSWDSADNWPIMKPIVCGTFRGRSIREGDRAE